MAQQNDSQDRYESAESVIRDVLNALDSGEAAEIDLGHESIRVHESGDIWESGDGRSVLVTNEDIPTEAGIAPQDVEGITTVDLDTIFEVGYRNPHGATETAIFQGSKAAEIFIEAIEDAGGFVKTVTHPPELER